MQNNTTTDKHVQIIEVETLTFLTIFKNQYIRNIIFNQIDQLPKSIGGSCNFVKGKELIALEAPLSCILFPNVPCSNFMGDKAIRDGNIEMVDYLVNHRIANIVEHIGLRFHFISRNDAAMVKLFLDYFHNNKSKYKIDTLAYILPSIAGYFEMFKSLYQQLSLPQADYYLQLAVKTALEGGFLDTIEFLHSNNQQFPDNPLAHAAEKGHLKIVQFLTTQRPTENSTTYSMDNAAKNGHFEVVQYLDQNRTEGCTTNAMDEAAKNGHFEIVMYLDQHRSEGCTTNAMDNASLNGHLSIVEYLDQHRSEGCTQKALNNASENGHLPIVKYLCQHRSEGDIRSARNISKTKVDASLFHYLCQEIQKREGTTIADFANSYQEFMNNLVFSGQVDGLKYCYANTPFRCKVKDLQDALQYNYREAAQFILDRGIELNENDRVNLIGYAALGGYLDLVKLYHSGCNDRNSCTKTGIDYAAQRGHLSIVEYLHFNCRHGGGCTTEAMNRAAQYGKLSVVQFLDTHRTEGCTPSAMNFASESGQLAVVKYLHRVGKKCTVDAMTKAQVYRKFEVISFLHYNRTEGCVKRVKQSDCVEIMQFLVHHKRVVNYPEDLLFYDWEIEQKRRNQY
ncbi:hypothetical protein DFA_06464 [Cavenderia fasciculata]|uniref:Ankyrin repeat-containing protein n=1 Tax=Cavenderia fasciculata TaxID=261658 RepID=F4PJ28_CACFS|nr:uncharacterized protein DFA_06464 [Cavenderia fasciculata]EGG24314.1 hypothetical protein DFA_06464 [Cavenderia fasciculata]|eukprot:XP_004362165.1 hypothetical protein DFA_06464 [Cavenderia fasciculata]